MMSMEFEKIGSAGLVVRGLLSAVECQQLIQLAEEQGFVAAAVRTLEGQKSMPLVRNNQRTLLDSPEWVALLWARLAALPLPVLDGQSAVGLPKDLRFYKYDPGERFKMHKDGPWHEDGQSSKLTALFYLNDGYEGGETVFRDATVVPETGMLLLFEHPNWHEGTALTAGTKYVMRSDVMYA